MADTLLELEKVSKFYTGGQSVVVGLNEVSLSFARGEFVAVTGESGSGKSTLAQVVSGILPYESGEMRISGKPTSHYDGGDWERYRRESVSYISQSYGILPGSTVLTNVVSALRILGMEKEQARTRAEELLKMVELWDLRSRRAAKLSSGQKQRLSIARALAKPAPILVADEPTGNLDSENSARVIRLLAKAAKERLVILITHDFQEAEGYATRRVALQDGRVILDMPLRPRQEPQPETEPERRQKKGLSAYITGLQIGGRPVWAGLVGLFFALTAFAVFAFLGTFIVNLDDTSTRVYDDSAFANGDKTRLVVQRMDSEPFTREDYDRLLEADHVRLLERNSYLADWQYAWRQDVDYVLHYHTLTVGTRDNNEKQVTTSVELMEGQMDYLQTVPVLPGDREFLTDGRLPETMYEVVIAGEPGRIGESLTVYIKDRKSMGAGSYIKIDVTIVGATDFGSGLYFGDELARVINNYLMSGGWDNQSYMIAPNYGEPFRTVDEGVFMLEEGYDALPESEGEIILYTEACNKMIENPDGTYTFAGVGFETLPVRLRETGIQLLELKNLYLEMKYPAYGNWIGVYTEQGAELPDYVLDREAMLALEPELADMHLEWLAEAAENVYFRVREVEEDTRVVDLYLYSDTACAASESVFSSGRWYSSSLAEGLGAIGYHDSPFVPYVLVTKAAFDQIVPEQASNQVSLYLTDYAYTDRAMEQLQDMGYLVISPFRHGATEKDATLAAERMKTLQICLLALLAVAVLQLLVLRELFGVQNGSYKLLADMGLGCTQAKRSLLWQMLLFTAIGQGLAFGAIWVCGAWGVRRIQTIIRYLPGEKWLILVLVQLLIALAAALMAMGNMKKRVYPQTGEAGDLNLDPLDKEAAV